jgi:2-hydroxy-3-keto-5-methylthiopentenyl-1-phosphate phosphatase
MERPVSVFIDFDGTLVVPNVAILLVERFGKDGVRVAARLDRELHEGRITLRQAWEEEAALLDAAQVPQMIDYVLANAPLRAGARELVGLFGRYRVRCTVLSGGLDFYIDPVLRREGIPWSIRSETSVPGPDGRLLVLHPYGHPTCRLCGICKAEAVRPPPGGRTVFVGDGSTDRYAAEVADVVFARHRLHSFCRGHGIPCVPFEELGPVVERMEGWLSGQVPWPDRGRIGMAGSPCPISRELAVGPAGGGPTKAPGRTVISDGR